MAMKLNGPRPGGSFQQLKMLADRFSYINWALADQAIVSGASFITTVLIARYLGMEEFGRFALAWLGVFFAQNLQIALVVAPMMTIGPKQPGSQRSTYTGSVILQQGVIAAATTGVVYFSVVLADLFAPEWRLGTVVVPLTVLVLVGQCAEFLRRYYFTFNRARISFTIDFARYGSQTVFLLGLCEGFVVEASISAVLYAMAVAALIGLILGLLFFGPVSFQASNMRRTLSRHWYFARWLIPTAVANWCRENFVYTAIAATLGLSAVGALRAAQQLVRMVNVPIQGFDNIVPMRAGAAFAGEGFGGLVDFVDGFVLRYTAAISAMLLVIAIFGNFLLTLIYGAEYAGYEHLVAAYAAIIFLYLVRNVLATMLRAMETTIFEFYASISGAVLVTAGSLPLVRAFGMPGAMVALAMFECVIILSLSFGLQRRHVAGM
ncbi:polysaccharide biosynthesis protein [bacterium BMS3Bbin10]|nr:polysaccharide biosynthesis protein [bacterium BMS3Bbin10]